MSDNKLSRFSSSGSSLPSSTLQKTKQLSLIDNFYDNRKNLFDICGNFINKEKYQFINILSTYLVDIVNSIDIEINKSTRNSMINWREKKNPKLLSKFINSDDNINVINRSMNKITSSNYLSIVAEISSTLMQDNFRKLPEYSKFLFDTIIKKCLNDEKFATDYLHFITAFDGVIGININQYVNEFISQVMSLMYNNTSLKCNDTNSYFSYIKDASQYMNIGIILANLYLIKNESNSSSNIKMYLIISESTFCEKFISSLNHINNYLEWLSSDMNDLIARIYLVFGIIEIIGKNLFDIISENDRYFLNDILTLIYNVNTIPNKIKFKVLDIQDMIKTFNKSKQSSSKSLNTSVEISSKMPVEMPVEIPVEINNTFTRKTKNISYTSLKLVQMNTNKTSNEPVSRIETQTNLFNKSEIPNVEVSNVEVSNVEVSNVEVSNVGDSKIEVPIVELSNLDLNNKNDNVKQDKDLNNRNKNYNRNKNRNKNKIESRQDSRQNINIESKSEVKTESKYEAKSEVKTDDDGFIKIERKNKINNTSYPKSNNNFIQKNHQLKKY